MDGGNSHVEIAGYNTRIEGDIRLNDLTFETSGTTTIHGDMDVDGDLRIEALSRLDGDNLHVGFSEFIGPSTFAIDEAGNFTLTADPPSLGETLEIIGTITEAGFAGTYDIPGLAEGTFSAAPVG